MLLDRTIHSDSYVYTHCYCLKIMQIVHLVNVELTNQSLQNPCNGVLTDQKPPDWYLHLRSFVTGCSPKKIAARTPPPRQFLPVAPIDSQWTLFCSTGIVPVEIMEWPGTVRLVAL